MYSKEIIKQIHQKLPAELLEAITSEKTTEFLNSISEKNQLSLEQMNKLSSIITWKLMGLLKETELATKIESEINVESGIARGIVADISNQILSEIPDEIAKKQEDSVREIVKLSSSQEPIVITQETKKAVIEELSQRLERARQRNSTPISKMLGKAPEIHPMVEPAPTQGLAASQENEKEQNIPPVEPVVEKPVPKAVEEPKPPVTPPTPIPPEVKLDSTSPTSSTQASSPQINMPQAETEAKKPVTPPTDARYPGGVDPYREPLV